MVGGVVCSIIMSPFLAGLAVSIGVPILLCYVYGVVPIALCRSEGMPEKRIKISKILILVGKNLLKDCGKTVLDQTYTYFGFSLWGSQNIRTVFN